MADFNVQDVENFYRNAAGTPDKELISDLTAANALSAPFVKFAADKGISVSAAANIFVQEDVKQLGANPEDLVNLIKDTALAFDADNFKDAMRFIRAMAQCSATCREELEAAEQEQNNLLKKAALEALFNRLCNLTLQDQIAQEAQQSLRADLEENSDQLKAYRDRLKASKSEVNGAKKIQHGIIDQAAERAASQTLFNPYGKLGALLFEAYKRNVLVPYWIERYGRDIVLKDPKHDSGKSYLNQKANERGLNYGEAPVAGDATPAPAARAPGMQAGF